MMGIGVWSVTIFSIILAGCVNGNPRNEGKGLNRRGDPPPDTSRDSTTLPPLPPPPTCFKRHPYSALSYSIFTPPFRQKKYNDSPQVCADLCTKIHEDQEEAHACRSFDYNIRTGTCHFFEKTGQDENVRIVDSTKTHFYELDERCLIRRKQPPHISACQAGFKPLMERVTGWYLKASGLAFKQLPEKECVQECLKDQTPGRHENFKCQSISYNSENKICVYLNQIAKPLQKNGPPLTVDSRYNYYSKFCLPNEAVAKCPGFVTRFIGKQLVAMSDAKITTSDYGGCVQACLTSQTKLGFACRSGMFYNKQSRDNCILNYSDHYDEHTLFIDGEEQIDYFSLRSCQW